MRNVILAYPDMHNESVSLVDVPRVGDYIRLQSAKPDESSLVVEQVQWTDGEEPNVIVAVRPHRDTRTFEEPHALAI
jgi:hypothetical protein